MIINKFGSNAQSRDAVILALKEFWGDFNGSENAEKLYDYLISEVESNKYDETCDLTIEKGRIKLYQSAPKEYYHSGSEQPRKFIFIDFATEDQFNGYDEVPLDYFYQTVNWASLCAKYVQVQNKKAFRSPVLIAFDFLGIPLVKIERTIYTE